MNNLAETVWHENPVILGAIAGSGTFDIKVGKVKGKLDLIALVVHLEYLEDCTLITRSIDSLSDEDLLEAESTFNIPSYKSVTKWLMDNKERLDVFIWLLSKGIWTGSKEGVEVVE